MTNQDHKSPNKHGWYIVDPDLKRLLEDLPDEKQEQILEKALSQEVEPGDPAFTFLLVSLILVELTHAVVEEHREDRSHSELLVETIERESVALQEAFTTTKDTVRAVANRIESQCEQMLKVSRQLLKSLGEEEMAEEMTKGIDWGRVNWLKQGVTFVLVLALAGGGLLLAKKVIESLEGASGSGMGQEVHYASLP